MPQVLLIDFGSTYTKVTVVDSDEEYILGTSKSFTTVQTDIEEGLDKAIQLLEEDIGKIDCSIKLACSSAAGGLRMVTVGLVPDLTAEAAKMAALSAGAKVMKVFSFELSPSEAEEIYKLEPDIILLTGGTDGGNKEVILHNANIIAQIEGDFPVVVAGNKSVADRVVNILQQSGKEALLCENVMPRFNLLNIEPARECIRNIFLRKIIQAKGLTKIQSLIEGIMMPTPSAVLTAVQYLAVGYEDEKGLDDLMLVDVGGATTDVYSIGAGNPTCSGVVVKGLPEPFAKRTVEGDLGVRYSAQSLIDAVGIENIMEYSKLEKKDVFSYIEKFKQNPGLLPENDVKMKYLDYGLTALAIRCAVERHVGKIETSYTPFGVTYVQAGKDLTNFKTIIGTGGPVINSIDAKGVLGEGASKDQDPTLLKPVNPRILLDSKYILAAMGLLSERFPKTAIRIMKRELRRLD